MRKSRGPMGNPKITFKIQHHPSGYDYWLVTAWTSTRDDIGIITMEDGQCVFVSDSSERWPTAYIEKILDFMRRKEQE
jgi:hypothetical protein